MRHSTWVKMRTNTLIVDVVNAEADRASDSTVLEEEPSTDLGIAGEVEEPSTDSGVAGADGEGITGSIEEQTDGNVESGSEVVPVVLEEERPTGTDPEEVIEVLGETEGGSVCDTEIGGTRTGGQTEVLRRSARIAGGTKPPVRYVQATFVGKDWWEEPAAEAAINSEIT
jgi:hypothetical protein